MEFYILKAIVAATVAVAGSAAKISVQYASAILFAIISLAYLSE